MSENVGQSRKRFYNASRDSKRPFLNQTHGGVGWNVAGGGGSGRLRVDQGGHDERKSGKDV